VDSETVVAIEPVKVVSTSAGQNVVAGMAIVSIDVGLATLGMGDVGMVYSESLVFTLIVGILMLLAFYRLTLKPFEVLSDDLDRALKGDLAQVTHEYRMEELNGLYDLINSALQRVPKDGGPGGSDSQEPPFQAEEAVGALRMMSAVNPALGLVLCDSQRRIVHINDAFEEMSGIRGEAAAGQEIPAVARDQAFGALVNDLFERVAQSPEGAGDDIEFSGVQHRVSLAALGPVGGAPRLYLLAAARAE
jgi:PAS domain-containing protein